MDYNRMVKGEGEGEGEEAKNNSSQTSCFGLLPSRISFSNSEALGGSQSVTISIPDSIAVQDAVTAAIHAQAVADDGNCQASVAQSEDREAPKQIKRKMSAARCFCFEPGALPASNRYFEALKGPEMDSLRAKEELVLPDDKEWPFLLRFPISSFGMCLGVGSQAVLWKTLATSPSISYIDVSPSINLVLWCVAVALFILVALTYALKIVFYFEAVKREYFHPVRNNFFFSPWIACLFFANGLPPRIGTRIPAGVWYALMAPILLLELKIYGQWMSGGKHRLSKVANPSNHLAVVGNFVGALLGASMGLREGPIFFFAVGLAHYTVVFVTLYQRLPTNDSLPKELHPIFFLFIATPSTACTAWAAISDEFGLAARIPYFVAMFLYASLAVRVNFFRGFRFSLAWWAYTYPMASSAIATIRYTEEVDNITTRTIAFSLSIISTFTVSFLLISTVLHAFVFRDLFQNDIAIAISHKKSKPNNKCPHLQNDIEAPDQSFVK